MHQVQVERVIDAPTERVWAVLDDFGAVYRYHPLVDRSPIQNDIASGLGAERVCHFDDGGTLREEITDYVAGQEYEITVREAGSFPVKQAVGRLKVKAQGDSRTLVTFHMAFEPKYGPLGWLMAKTVMARGFRKILGGVLAGLERHLATGETVSRGRSRQAA